MSPAGAYHVHLRAPPAEEVLRMRARFISPVAAVGVAVLAVAGCGGSHSAGSVPSLQGSAGSQAHAHHNSTALHAAAQCIRDNGVPNYADPVIGPGDVVYADQRSLEKVSDSVVNNVRRACSALAAAANWDPSERPHPTAQMLRDGVREAQCLRAHGLPNWPDPQPSDTFDPGHGFQVNGDAFAGAVAPGENPKQSAAFRNAAAACQSEIEATMRDSQLANLAHGQ
jgi:hypothetical protein